VKFFTFVKIIIGVELAHVLLDMVFPSFWAIYVGYWSRT